jgi:hypothetical protein
LWLPVGSLIIDAAGGKSFCPLLDPEQHLALHDQRRGFHQQHPRARDQRG